MKIYKNSWYKEERFLEEIPLEIVSDGVVYKCLAVCTSEAAFGDGIISGVTAIKYPDNFKVADDVHDVCDVDSVLDQIIYIIVEGEQQETTYEDYKVSFKLERLHVPVVS